MFLFMGGFGSGRSGGQPLADSSLRVDIGWMLRTDRAKEGSIIRGSLFWHRDGEQVASINYTANMADPHDASLELRYANGSGDTREAITQRIRLCHTQPNYGGRHWWMICPFRGYRCLKLYMPGGGDRFASRHAWRLGYHSQRIAADDRAFYAMHRIQQRLGGRQGCDEGLPPRPKGMWHRTYNRLGERFDALDDHCGVVLVGLMMKLHRA